MKMKKLLAAAAVTAAVATMAVIPASAASSTAYMYTVQPSWSGTSANDTITGGPEDKAGYGDLKNWDSGDAWNGNWIQIELSSDNLDGTSIEFTVDTTAATFQTEGNGEALTEWTIIRVADVGNSTPYTLIVDDNTKGTYTYTMTSDNLKKALEDGKAQLKENEDGSYTLGMNIQIGHLANAKVTGVVTSDVLLNAEDESSSETTSSEDGNGSSDVSSEDENTTSSGDDTASTSGNDTGSTDESSSQTGATTGLALVGMALAGAAIAVSRKRK